MSLHQKVLKKKLLGRKALEQCAWDRTPPEDRRDVRPRWRREPEQLVGNNREIRVFDPTGFTETTMSPLVPLWALQRRELQQRCRLGREPRLRDGVLRIRPDYVSNIDKDLTGAQVRKRR